jgi:Flp pilus assembly protein TadB
MADDSKQSPPLPPASEFQTPNSVLVNSLFKGLEKTAGFTSDGILKIVFMIAVTVGAVIIGIKTWNEPENAREERRHQQDMEASRMREANAQAELNRQQGAANVDKVLHHCDAQSEKARKDGQEMVKMMLATFVQEGEKYRAEGEKNRAFWAQENEKTNKVIADSIKHRTSGP